MIPHMTIDEPVIVFSLVMPEQPRFDAKINDIAKQIVCNIEPDYNKIGQIVGFVLEKK